MNIVIKLLDWLMSGQQEQEVSWRCFIERVISFLLRLLAIGFIYWLVSDAVGVGASVLTLLPPTIIAAMR